MYSSLPAKSCAGQTLLTIAILIGLLSFGIVLAGKYLTHDEDVTDNSATRIGETLPGDRPGTLATPALKVDSETPLRATGRIGPDPDLPGTRAPTGTGADTREAGLAVTTTAPVAAARGESFDIQTTADGKHSSQPGGGRSSHIEISGSGDRISVTRQDTGSLNDITGSTDSASGNESDLSETGTNPEYTYQSTPEEDIWSTPNCPNRLPAGSTVADAEAMRASYGCGYSEYCRALNDGTGDIDCWYGLRFIPPAS